MHIMDKPVAALGAMSTRLYNCLIHKDKGAFETVYDVLHNTEKDLLRLAGFGKTSLEELEKLLAVHGLSLEEDPSIWPRIPPPLPPLPVMTGENERLFRIEAQLARIEHLLLKSLARR